MGVPKHPLSYLYLILQFTWVGLHCISMYVLIRVFVFYFTLGSAWVFTALDSLSGAGLCWSFCLSTFISTFCLSYSSLSHVLVNFYVFGISIMLFQTVIMYLFWDFVIVASWTTMVFYIPLRVILIVLCL